MQVSESRSSQQPDTTGTHHAVPLFDIQDPPQIPDHRSSDRCEGEESHHLATECAGEEESGRHQISPPFRSEFAGKEIATPSQRQVLLLKPKVVWNNSPVPILMELDVRQQGQAHEQDQRRVEQDQPRLGDMSVVCR
jgi:hypothetical protein